MNDLVTVAPAIPLNCITLSDSPSFLLKENPIFEPKFESLICKKTEYSGGGSVVVVVVVGGGVVLVVVVVVVVVPTERTAVALSVPLLLVSFFS